MAAMFSRVTWRSPAVWVTLGFVLAVVAFAAIPFALEAKTVASSLLSAQDHATRLKDQLAAGDSEGAQASLAQLQRESAQAHESSRGGMWNAAAKIPWLGSNVEAVQVTAASIDDISV